VNIRRATALASLALLPFAGAAHAQDAPSQAGVNDDLRQEIEAQKQRLAVLERKLEIQDEAAKAAAASAPRITASATRFQIGSADGANFIRFRGTLFADNRAYAGDSAPETADTFRLTATDLERAARRFLVPGRAWKLVVVPETAPAAAPAATAPAH